MKINRDNYEAFLLDRIEGNLNAEELKLLDEFLQANKDLQVQDDLYDENIVTSFDENIYFKDKNGLLHDAEHKVFKLKRRHIIMKISSVAALVLLVLVIGLLIKINRDNINKNSLLTDNINSLNTVELPKTTSNGQSVATIGNMTEVNNREKTVKRPFSITNDQIKNKKESETALQTMVADGKQMTDNGDLIFEDNISANGNSVTEVEVKDMIVYETAMQDNGNQTAVKDMIIYETSPQKTWIKRAEDYLNERFDGSLIAKK